MLEAVDVDRYLSDRLGIVNWQQKLQESRLNFLQELMTAHQQRIYYQNATWGSLIPSQRKSPTVEDIISHSLSSAGGSCFQLNYFIKLILQHLKYNVWISSGESPAMPVPNNHIVTIVSLPRESERPVEEEQEEEDLYLFDVGFGRPILEIINVTKLHTSPFRSRACGFEFEYRFNSGKQIYERVLYAGCPIKGKLDEGLEGRVDYFFNVKPLEYSDFKDTIEVIFTNPSASFFLNTLFLFRFLSLKGPLNFDFVSFRGRALVQGSASERTETTFASYIEMLPKIMENFPLLNKEEVQLALLNYDQRSLSSNK